MDAAAEAPAPELMALALEGEQRAAALARAEARTLADVTWMTTAQLL
jgi:hypothetical protein